MYKMSTGLFCLTFLLILNVTARDPAPPFEVPTTKPTTVVQQRLAATIIEITYSRPSARHIFGVCPK